MIGRGAGFPLPPAPFLPPLSFTLCADGEAWGVTLVAACNVVSAAMKRKGAGAGACEARAQRAQR